MLKTQAAADALNEKAFEEKQHQGINNWVASHLDGEVVEIIRLEMDAQMVGLMHRRALRLSMIIAGTDPNEDNPLFHKLDPILN